MFYNNLAYEASAGSGKTFMLVVRYLSLLFRGADGSKILALTFTNKAANEMQERIITTLEELEFRDELNEIIKLTELSKEEILTQRKTILMEFLNSQTKIMTIDSFFTQILRKFSLYSSLMPDFTTMSSQHEMKLLEHFLKEVDVANQTKNLVQLSLESKKRFSDIFALLHQFYEKKQELSNLTFKPVKTQSFEQIAMDAVYELKILIDNCQKASTRVKSAVDIKKFSELLKKPWIAKESLDYVVFSKCFDPVMNDILTRIQNAIFQYYRAKEQNFFYTLYSLVQTYDKSKKVLYRDDSELSFADVTVLVHYLLKERIDSEFLYFRLDAQIEHMLLDEFQDTSILQYEILKPLIAEIVSGEGIFKEGSFFFVGDVKQSIYRFRGGVSALFSEVAKASNTKVEPLLVNYRSKEKVVSFVNTTFRDKISSYQNQKTLLKAKGGFVEIVQNDDILQGMLEKVLELKKRGIDENNIAILCATNGDGVAVQEILESQSIKVVTETTTKLINQKSIKAILEYLKYLYFREDIYRYNFFSLISRDLESINFVALNIFSLREIVKKVVQKYKLFSNDFHILRFLEVLSKYKDIESLLFEYERLDVTATTNDVSGIHVLTTHKSKGLEYENVIVIDRLKKVPASRDTIIYEYDGIVLKNIYLRIKDRDKLDSAYAKALEKERNLVYEDKLNTLYVAFTRARDNLFIIQKSKDSIFDILDLTPSSYGIFSYENKVTTKEEKSYQNLDFKEFYYGMQNDILSYEEDTKEDIQAQNFGIALHYMLEMLESFTQNALDNGYSMMLNKYGHILEKKELEDIYKRVQMLILDTTFLSLVDGVCYKEKGIKYKKNLFYIDLLVHQSTHEYIVIDYKSSQLDTKHHKKQVKSYINMVKQITNSNVNGYICYILENRIELVVV